MPITKDTIAEFTWNFNMYFYVETAEGNYIWSDPDYGGDNTLKKTHLSYAEWIDPDNKGLFGRFKGTHTVGRYCGDDVKIIEE